MRGLSDTFGSSLYDLPQTREEVIEVNEIVGKDGVVLLGTDATETAFKSASLVDFKIIHIAAHGFADTQFPERSGLVLGVASLCQCSRLNFASIASRPVVCALTSITSAVT